MIGKVFGELTCLKQIEKPPHIKGFGKYYLFKCSCGNDHITSKRLVTRDKYPTTRCTSCSKTPKNKADIIGKTFGELTCLRQIEKTNNYGRARYVFSCSCGSEYEANTSVLTLQDKPMCPKCRKKMFTKQNNPKWKGFGEISGSWWWDILHNNRNIPVSISIGYAWELFIKQNKKCRFSGIELTFPKTNKDNSGTASLDRIDSTKGYIEGNVQWVHKDINIMKMNKSDKEFIKMCGLIYHNNLLIS